MNEWNEMEGATEIAAEFRRELSGLTQALADAEQGSGALQKSLSRSLGAAFEGVIFDGMKASDALRNVAKSMIDTAYSSAMKPVTNHFAGLISGGIQSLTGSIMPFAKGGVVNGPTTFPMQGATGLMGEAGPEAIMPLTRGADGRLGVRAQGGSQNVTINIQTPDVEGFRRSRSQVAAQMQRMLGAGARNR